MHIIRLPLHHEEEALVLVRTVKWSVPDQLLLSMSSEPQKDVLFTEENLYKRKKKKKGWIARRCCPMKTYLNIVEWAEDSHSQGFLYTFMSLLKALNAYLVSHCRMGHG